MQLPMEFGQVEYKLPSLSDLPNPSSLTKKEVVSLDFETNDPGLRAGVGPGGVRGGYIAGVAIALRMDGQTHSCYLPTRHEDGINLDEGNVHRWLGDILTSPATITGFNLPYELEYLAAHGIPFNGPYFDVQIAYQLLHERRKRVSLDDVSWDILGERKVETELKAWICSAHGLKSQSAQREWKSYLHTAPARMVEPYGIGDVELPLRMGKHLADEIRESGLQEALGLEHALLEPLNRTRMHGVRVDVEAAERAVEKAKLEVKAILQDIKNMTGVRVDIWSAESIAQAFREIGFNDFKLTAKTRKPSITKQWLENNDLPLSNKIIEARELEKLRSTFLEGYIGTYAVNGRIHCLFNSLGTETGRFSSSHPNLQNIPKRNKTIKNIIRAVFIPEPGELWHSLDYSQVEYRHMAHDAVGPKAEYLREQYRQNPDTDYHQATQETILDVSGVGLERPLTKNVNFGFIYGMMEYKLAGYIGLDMETAKDLFRIYHEGAPWVKATFNHYAQLAQKTGEIRTITGRRRKFDRWEPIPNHAKDMPLPYNLAVEQWPGARLKRAYTYKALNTRLQGGAAEIMKLAIVKSYEEGIWDEIGPMLTTVHDEFNCSAPLDHPAISRLKECMEHATELRVPLLVDHEVGNNWADLHERDKYKTVSETQTGEC